MRLIRIFAVAALLTAPAAPGRAADLTPLFPDDAWMVVGINAKGLHESPLGRKVFGKDDRYTAARKLLAALGNENGVDLLKALAPCEPVLNRVTQVTAVAPPSGQLRGTVVFLEGDFGDDTLARAIEGVCKQQKMPYKTEKAGGRTVHVAGDGESVHRVVRLDKTTVAVLFTATAVSDLLDRHAGKKASKAPKVVVEGVRAIDPAATPVWMVVGENRVNNQVDYTRMVATVSVGADATLRVRMEAPDEAAAGRCKETLDLFAKIFSLVKDKRLMKELGVSSRVEKTGTTATATASLSGKSLTEEYAEQK
ncbi:MAG TPA: hypothetical protein VFG68_23155 [Fimbriiglobus sp.]|nr:hypothetical protein [Fimbriiglobus sp.]